MVRTSVMLPDDVARLVQLEAQRRRVTASVVIRDAVASHVARGRTEGKAPTFAGLFGHSDGPSDVARHVDEILEGTVDDLAECNGLDPRGS